MLDAPSIGMQKIRNLYQRALTNSVSVLREMNSIKNVLVSTVFYCLLYHSMGALFTNIRTPVCDIMVDLLPALSVFTKKCVETKFLLGVGLPTGMASFASR